MLGAKDAEPLPFGRLRVELSFVQEGMDREAEISPHEETDAPSALPRAGEGDLEVLRADVRQELLQPALGARRDRPPESLGQLARLLVEAARAIGGPERREQRLPDGSGVLGLATARGGGRAPGARR